MNEERNREYKDFLEQLISDADLETLKSSALNLYRDGWRHSYATLFPILTKLYEEQEADDDNDKSLDAILYKLDALQKNIGCDIEEEKSIKPEAAQENTEKELVQTKLEKLKDHIALEINRIRKWGPTHKAYIRMLQDVDQAKEAMKDIKEQQEKMEAHYITILGIFAAIVIGATGAVSISSAVYECVVGSSDTKLVIAGSLHLLLCIDILYFLIQTIGKTESNIEKFKYLHFLICLINIIVPLAIAGLAFWSMYK